MLFQCIHTLSFQKTLIIDEKHQLVGILLSLSRYPHLPCLQVGQEKDRFLPMEVCTIIPCQKRHLSKQQIANMIKSTARPAPERQKDIQIWVDDGLLFVFVLFFFCL